MRIGFIILKEVLAHVKITGKSQSLVAHSPLFGKVKSVFLSSSPGSHSKKEIID